MTERELGLRATREEATADRSLDEVAKGLADGTLSRRRALRVIGATLIGAAVTSISGVAWAAPPEGRGRPCPKGEKKCGDTCCSSPEDLCCHRVCTNIVFDRNNCGACGNVCATGEDCCGGRCVPLNTRDNCGCCGCGCLEAEICVNGSCQCPEPGQTVCANVCCPEGHCVFDEATQSFRCVA